ncbi:hypothetical protein B0H10DRAFT_2089726 [Mycena sp. CBHHK59/15]|nr:hypothetical protein B0H10DRAFT_2089726 [Mycena sp. CBHHK59/15]
MGLRDAGEFHKMKGSGKMSTEVLNPDLTTYQGTRGRAARIAKRDKNKAASARYYASKPGVRERKRLQVAKSRTMWDIRCLTPSYGLPEHLQVSLDRRVQMLEVRSPAEQDAIYVLTELSNRRGLEAAYSNQGLQFNSGTPVTHQKDSTRGKATLGWNSCRDLPPDLPPSDDLGTSEEEYDIPEYGYKPAVDRQVNITPDDTWMLYAPKYDSSDDDLV